MFGASNTGFGGFGQQQQQQQQPAQQGLFGGSGAFGAPPATPAPAFGQPAQSGFGGFGAAPVNSFGNQAQAAPAFGSGGGLFGTPAPAPAASSGFSFGASNTGFGAPATQAAGGLFGAKPATSSFGGGFGAAPAAGGGGLFGQGSPSTFGAAPVGQPGQGTANPPFQSTSEKDVGATTTSVYQSISCMPAYKNYLFEELRLQDYAANRKHPAANTFGGSSFGAPQQQSAFGAPAPANNMFGAAPSAFGTPAQPARTGFGAAPSSGGLFGGSGGFGQPQQPAAPTSLFGAPAAPQTGMFGGFGAPAAAAPAFGSPAAGGLFGQAPKPAANSFSFGQPAAPAMGGGGLFGQPQQPAQQNAFGQPPAPAGGLFGQPAQPAAGGFSFGAPKPLFGAAPAAGAFGAAPATENKPAFSFGQPAATGGLFGAQPQPGFGAPAAAPQPGLFGGAAPGGFGQPAANTFGAGLFGAKPAAPTGSLFGAQPAAPTGSLFGAPPAAQPSLFGGLGNSFGGAAGYPQQQQLQQSQFQQQQQPQLYASVDDNAYGTNPLFANVGAQTAPVNPFDNKKKPPISTAFRGTPKSSSKITRLRGFGTSSVSSPGGAAMGLGSSMNGSPAAFGNGSALGTPSSGRASPLHLVNGIGEDALLGANAFVSRPSVKKLIIDRKVGDDSLNRSRSRTPLANASPDIAPPKRDAAVPAAAARPKDKVTFNPELDYSTSSPRDRLPASNLRGGPSDTFGSSTPLKGKSSSNLAQSPANFSTDSISAPLSPTQSPTTSSTIPTTANLSHGDYYTIPSLDRLHKLPAAALQALPDLVVGRVGYGEVSFHASVNLTTLSSVDRLLGDVVIFEDRNCTVYPPDYEGKPSPGDGLNVPATINLLRCWPVSKSTREPIKDMENPKLTSHIKRLRNLEGTRFIEFDAEEGKWTFEVEGF